MALADNIIDRHGPSNEMHRQLQLKKDKVMLYYPFIQQQKAFYPPFIANKTKRFSFENGFVIRVKNSKMHCQL